PDRISGVGAVQREVLARHCARRAHGPDGRRTCNDGPSEPRAHRPVLGPSEDLLVGGEVTLTVYVEPRGVLYGAQSVGRAARVAAAVGRLCRRHVQRRHHLATRRRLLADKVPAAPSGG
ncbi:jg26540, partial [Pararge aegeria aegeria]